MGEGWEWGDVCFKWPNHTCSCSSPTFLPPQFLKSSQLLNKLSLNVRSSLIVIVASETSKPRAFLSILDKQERKEVYFFLFFKNGFVNFILQRHLNSFLSISISCKTPFYGNLLGLGNSKEIGFSFKMPQFKASYGKYVVMHI